MRASSVMSVDGSNRSGLEQPVLSSLFEPSQKPMHADLLKRAEVTAANRLWQPCKIPGLLVSVLELHTSNNPRMTALLRVDPMHSPISIPATDLEIMVQHGIVADSNSEYLHPYYIRHPAIELDESATFDLHAGDHGGDKNKFRLEFYVATGQIASTDTEQRCINLAESSLWLPGPVENTQVMPLHMHKGNNSMLVKWNARTQFKPKLDPRGEEVLVLKGLLEDEAGQYAEGSWIRNPVSAWQAWRGDAGTVIYYKNGHFG